MMMTTMTLVNNKTKRLL